MQRLSRTIALGYIAICLVTLAGTALFGPLGYAPFPLVRAPERPPITVTVWYSTEKQAWLEQAKQRFDATGPVLGGRKIQIQLKGLGSREIAERVAARDWRGDTPPTVASPASSMWVERMQAGGGQLLAGKAYPLALTPLVVVGWEERAKTLWPDRPRDFWRDLHDAVANPGGWQALGGKQTWGLVKLGHTAPLTSNGGTQALILLAYGFYNKNTGLNDADARNAEFVTWLGEIERGASAGESASGFMNDFINRGPSQYDFGIVYENLALQSMDAARNRQGQPLRIYYPPATLYSDHPYAVLQGDWVSDAQRQAAEQFRDFLLSNDMQRLALQDGFRPVIQGIDLKSGEANNPFNKYAPNGARIDLPGTVETPPAQVVDALLDVWRINIGR